MPGLVDEGFDRCGHDCSPNRRRDLLAQNAVRRGPRRRREWREKDTEDGPASCHQLYIMHTLPVCKCESYLPS